MQNDAFIIKVLSTANTIGKILLTSGAETYRVEEAITLVCRRFDLKSESFVTMTCVLTSAKKKDGEVITEVNRIYSVSNNLNKIENLINYYGYSSIDLTRSDEGNFNYRLKAEKPSKAIYYSDLKKAYFGENKQIEEKKSEDKEKQDVNEALRLTVKETSKSIVTSALSFFAATIGVGIYSKMEIVSTICIFLARGAIISMLVIIIFLPALIGVTIPFIEKTTKGLKEGKENE